MSRFYKKKRFYQSVVFMYTTQLDEAKKKAHKNRSVLI